MTSTFHRDRCSVAYDCHEFTALFTLYKHLTLLDECLLVRVSASAVLGCQYVDALGHGCAVSLTMLRWLAPPATVIS